MGRIVHYPGRSLYLSGGTRLAGWEHVAMGMEKSAEAIVPCLSDLTAQLRLVAAMNGGRAEPLIQGVSLERLARHEAAASRRVSTGPF